MREKRARLAQPGPVPRSVPKDTLVELDGFHTTTVDVVRIARDRARVEAPADAWERVARGRAVVERALARDEPVYGLTMGVGPLRNYKLRPDEIESFNLDVVLGHATPVFPEERPTEQVRAMIVARVNGMLRGGSGVRPDVVRLLVEMLNRGVHPTVHARGVSVGESDLVPLAEVGLVMVGLGEAEYRGARLSGADALRQAGLEPLRLAAKEGIAIISANALSVGAGALDLHDAWTLLAAFDTAGAVMLEAFAANLSALDPAVDEARPFVGQRRRAQHLRALLKGSALFEPGRAMRLLDPLSFRCIAQVHGACDDALAHAEDLIARMLNASVDNPLVVIEEERLISTGNFESTALALAFDQVRLAFLRLIVMSVQRAQKLLWTEFSGLPNALATPTEARTSMFFNNVSRVMAALTAKAYGHAAPASLTYHPQLSQGADDYASMAPVSLAQTAELLEVVRCVAALELLVASRAIELRRPDRLGTGTARAFEWAGRVSRACQSETGETDLTRFVKEMRFDELLRMLGRGTARSAP